MTLAEASGDDAAFALDQPRPSPSPPSDPPKPDADPYRLRRLWLRDFKGFQSFEIALGEFNVLAGPNNSGKSTILQGADLLFRLIDLHHEGINLATGRQVTTSVLPVADLRDLWFQRRYRAGNEFVRATIGGEFGDGAFVEFGVIGPFGAATSKLTDVGGMSGDRMDAILSRPTVWVPSSVGVVRDEEYRTAARRTGLVSGGRHYEVLRNQVLDLKRLHGAEFELLQSTLQRHFGGLIGEVKFDELNDEYVTATYVEGSSTHDLYSVGAGFLQVLQLMTFILSRSPSLVLLDEPDAHLHSSLQRSVIDVLDDLARQGGLQIVLSTHSKEIINYVDPTRLILIEKGSERAAPFGPEVTQVTILKSLGGIDSVDAYQLFRSRRCLFLEGSTDLDALQRLAAKVGTAGLSGDDRIVAVPVGGADRFEHIEQLKVVEGLLGGTIQSLEVRDRDGRTNEHRDREMADASRPLHVLELDCLESYLIEPGVVARVINDVLSERGDDRTVNREDVEGILVELTDSLRDVAIDRAADRYSRDVYRYGGARPTIPQANESARELVGAHWDSLPARLRVVPGKRLLALLRQRLQIDYGVSFGDKRLAEAFEVDEIPAEILDILGKIQGLAAP